MVLLVEKLCHSIKFPSKLENHHHRRHHQYEACDEASLQAFCSYISDSKFRPGKDIVSLSWVRNCFSYLIDSNKAFARLVGELDYPLSKWELPLMEEYLNYSLRLLDLLNLAKSSINHLGQSRLLMAHALRLFDSSASSAIERLRLVDFKNSEIDLKTDICAKEMDFSGKEAVIHQALTEMKKNIALVFGIVLSSLSSDIKPNLELQNLAASSKDFEGFSETNAVLKEFKEVNEAKACLVAAFELGKISEIGDEDVKKLEIKLEEIQKQLDDIGNKADDLFAEILEGRNKVLDVLRHRN